MKNTLKGSDDMKDGTLINYNKLRKDVENANKSLKDGISLSKRLDEAGIGNAIFANSLTALDRNKDIDVALYEDCDKKGIISRLRFFALCNLFNLNSDEYILKLKKETSHTIKHDESLEKLRKYMKDKNLIDEFIEQVKEIHHNTGNTDLHIMQVLELLTEKADRLDEWYKLFSDHLGQIDSNTYQIKKLNEAVEKLGNIETQNMEYLKAIADGIQQLNDKWNKPSAYQHIHKK